MTPELTVVGLAAVGVAVFGLLYRPSASRYWHPLRIAMTLTAVGLIYAGAALLGFAVPVQVESLHQIQRVGHVVWSQLEFGAAFGALSIPLWWLGVKELGRA